jgi:hypothetical protein
MKPDEDPWQNLATLPEPKLAPDFARRVLRQARMRRWRRQSRRRLIVACVFSAALGFAATTVIRVRLAQKNSPAPKGAVSRSTGAAPKNALKPFDGLAERWVIPTIKNFVLSGRMGGDSGSADAAGNGRGSGKVPLDSSTSPASQTLVLKATATSEERATSAPDQTVRADPVQPSPHQSPPAQSAGLHNAADAAAARQPAIHLP